MGFKSFLRQAALTIALCFATTAAWADTYYFDNTSTNWAQPYCYIWNSGGNNHSWPGEKMTLVDNGIWKYETSMSNLSGIIFNVGSDSDKTGNLTAVKDHVYTKDGDSGKTYEEYISDTPTPPDPGEDFNPTGKLFWTVPDKPSADQAFVLHYDNRKASTKLGNGDVYLYTGVVYQGDETANDGKPKWSHVLPNDWDYSQKADAEQVAKVKMTQDAENADHYTLSYQSVRDFYGASDETIVKVMLLFRTKSGTKAENNDQSFDLSYSVTPPSAGPLGAVKSYTFDNNVLNITCEKGKLVITPYAKDIVKVFTLKNGDTRSERAFDAVSLQPDAELACNVTEDDNYLTLKIDGGTQVSIDRTSSLISFADADGNIMLSEKKGLVNSNGDVRVSFMPMGEAAFYGGGYTGARANRDNSTMWMNNYQHWGYSSEDESRNFNIPMYISSNGYGIYFDSQYRNAQIKPSSTAGSTYSSASTSPIAYYYLGGGSMQQAVANYVNLTGHQDLPPYWALGYMTSKYSFRNTSEAYDAVNSTKAANMPIDGIVFDIHWQGEEKYMGRLDWGSNYSNAPQMLADFKNQNVNAICITEPYFTSNCGYYDTLNKSGYLADSDNSNMGWLNSSRVGLLDATNPKALDWMWDLYKARTREGVEGWWLDLGEPEQHDVDAHHQGGTVDEVHNEFGNLWTESVYNGLKRDFPDKRRFLMPRSGTAGMQRFSAFPWTGDIQRSWAGFQAQIPSLINASMSGIGYLGSDVGGFACNGSINTDAQLYERWVEFAVFSPMMRTHSAVDPMPYLDAYSSQRDNIRNMLNKRYSYLPYIYTQAYRYTTEGIPFCVPANFYDSNKSLLADCRDEFLCGRDILVAPVVNANATSRNVVFPEGKWVSLNDMSTIYNGGSTQTVSAPLGTLPHFARLGSAITRYAQDTYTNTASINRSALRIDYFHDPDNSEISTRLYDDDHTTPDPLSDNKYLLTGITTSYNNSATFSMYFTRENGSTGFDGMPEKTTYTLNMHNYKLGNNDNVYFTAYPSGSFGPTPLPEARHRAAAETKPVKLSAVDASALDTYDGNAYARLDNNKVRVKVTVPTLTPFALDFGGDGSITSVDDIEASSMLLSYADGALCYQIPDVAESGSISIYTTGGALVATLDGLTADGTLHRAELSLAPGIYIARLTAARASATTPAQVLRLLVR